MPENINTPFANVSNQLRGQVIKNNVLFGFSPNVNFSELVVRPFENTAAGVNYGLPNGKVVDANGNPVEEDAPAS